MFITSVPHPGKTQRYVKKTWAGCRDGLVVKSVYCSCRGPEFNSQYLHMKAHNCLKLSLQGILHLWPLQGPSFMWTYPHMDPHTDTLWQCGWGCLPLAQMSEDLVPRRWNCLGRIGKYGLVGGGLSLWVRLCCFKSFLPSPVLSVCWFHDVSSQLSRPLCSHCPYHGTVRSFCAAFIGCLGHGVLSQ